MSEDKIYSNLMRKIKTGEFVLTGELEPPKSCDISSTIKEAKEMASYIDAANVTDSPLAEVTISSLAASYLVLRDAKIEPVFQLTVRDMNKIGLAATLMGAHALGIRNVLSLTGDHPNMGDVPEAKPVFDLDSATLCMLVREMVDTGTINGHKIDTPPTLHVGAAANPNSNPMEPEILKIGRKAKAGCEFLQTQVVYDINITIEFLQSIKTYNLPVLLGIFPMKNYGMAKGFDMFVPGVDVPKDILTKWKDVKTNIIDKKEQKKKYDQLNIEFFGPFIQELKAKKLINGIHCMAVHYTRIFPQLVEIIKLY